MESVLTPVVTLLMDRYELIPVLVISFLGLIRFVETVTQHELRAMSLWRSTAFHVLVITINSKPNAFRIAQRRILLIRQTIRVHSDLQTVLRVHLHLHPTALNENQTSFYRRRLLRQDALLLVHLIPSNSLHIVLYVLINAYNVIYHLEHYEKLDIT